MRTMINWTNYCSIKWLQTMICDQNASIKIFYVGLNAFGGKFEENLVECQESARKF